MIHPLIILSLAFACVILGNIGLYYWIKYRKVVECKHCARLQRIADDWEYQNCENCGELLYDNR